MCGRFTLHHTVEEIAERFGVQKALFQPEPRYNVAPAQIVPGVTQNGQRVLQGFRWGLVPFWAKDTDMASKLINARAETLTEKPAFRASLKSRRCLIPADGFYEWKASEGKQPYHIRRQDGGLFAFAGLWDEWQPKDHKSDHDPAAEALRTCTIITGAPNALLSSLHHRMAIVLRPEDEAVWLDPSADVPSLLDCLQPYEYDEFEAYRIGRRVGRVGTDEPDLIAPLPGDQATPPAAEQTGSLFG